MKQLMIILTSLFLTHNNFALTKPLDKKLVSAKQIQFESAEQISKRAGNYGLTLIADKLQYDVAIKKIVYKTEFQGKLINVSGIACIPKGLKKPSTFVSIHHGTIFNQNEAPSNSTYGYRELVMLASMGYTLLIPDYIGYGESKDYFHPYYDYNYSSQTVIDLIFSVMEEMNAEKIPYERKVILAGYSEGGYVTLATHKRIETTPELNLQVVASASGAGGYDLPEVMETALIEKTNYSAPAYLAFVLMAYNKTYGWNRPLTDFISKQYCDELQSKMYGNYYGSALNSYLTTDIKKLFSEKFYNSLKGNAELGLKQKLKENSVSDWKAKAPVFLYHGTSDEIVPYNTSIKTMQTLKKNGSKNVELIPTEQGTHGSSYYPMLMHFVFWMMQQPA